MASHREKGSHATELSETQNRRLFIGLRHIDGLLAEVENILQSPESAAVFPRYLNDLSYAESRTGNGYARQLRQKLMDVVRWQGLPLPVPDIPARRAVSVRVAFIEIAIEEMKPKYFLGSRAVSPVAEEFLYGISGELREVASRMSAFVAETAAQALSERAQGLGNSVAALRIGTLAEIVSRQELVQFRPALQVLVEGFKTDSYQIAVFGRVSSGKSSLLNALLRTTSLPIGTIPVTAVPTRIEYAEEPLLEVTFHDGRSESVGPEALSAFASEEENPRNNKGVARLTLRLSLEALKAGLAFVDTPGIGSLARTGTKEAKAYLPSADLALVLIDAAGTLVEEDLDLLRLLDDAGIRSIVLLSKADLLSEEDLQKAKRYTADQLEQNLRTPPPIMELSSLSAWEPRCQKFYAEYIAPLAEKASEHRSASIQAKLLLLARRMLLALKSEASSSTKDYRCLNAEQEEQRLAIQSRLLAFESDCNQEVYLLRTGAARYLKEVSNRIASQLIEHGRRAVRSSEAQTVVASLIQTAVEPLIRQAAGIASEIDHLAQSAALGAASTDAYLIVRDAPLFEASETAGTFAAWWFVPEWLLRRKLAAFMTGIYEEQLRRDLEKYAERLTNWVLTCLSRLRATLLIVEDENEQPNHPSRSESGKDKIAEDISTLRLLLNDEEKSRSKSGGTAS